MRNLKKSKFSMFVLLCIAMVVVALYPQKKAEAAQKRLSSITAVYTGDTVLVGHSIDLEKLTVMGLYTDGSYVKLKDYVLTTYVVSKKGDNKFTVYAEGVTGEFTVKGKEVLRLSAYYQETSMTIGERLDSEKITVYAYYSDGSTEKVTDYVLSHTIVGVVGMNEFTVIYEGVTTKFGVTGKEERKPRSMYARYSGPSVIVGNAPKRDDFYVSIFYNDNTTERITEFELTPAVVQNEGSNVMIVSYGELSAEVKVQGLAKTVRSITAEYTGFPVVVGKTVATEDIKVTATFNDGTKDTVTNFTLSSSVIYKVGDNVVTVFCDGKMAHINVRGVEAEIIDYNNSSKAFIRDGDFYTRVTLAVGGKVDPEQVVIEKVDGSEVKKAVRRLVRTDKYMAFEVVFSDPELDTHLPMTMKVTVPPGFDRENFGVFYTPNRKTIMAQMNGEFVTDGSYEFKMFQPGTYIIADCTPLIYVESVTLEEEEMTLRLNRSYSLNPEILPHTATNKEVTYTSSRPQIVSVSEYGTLKALKTGTAIITVEATDGSGKKCKLRVNVVEKKGKFDADIAELSDLLNEVHTAADFIDFLEQLEENIEEKSYEYSERKFTEYVKELESWIGAWQEDSVDLDEDEWILLLELLYFTGEYSYAEWFGGEAMFADDIAELDRQLKAIETVEDFTEFYESFFLNLEEKLEEWEEEDALLYLMALLNWAEQLRQNKESNSWSEEIWKEYGKWIYQMGIWM